MKTVYLVRHAKSSWEDPGIEDIARPLKKRGQRDVALMGKVLRSFGARLDLIVSSPAVRAKETARALAAALTYPEETIVWVKELFDARVADVLQTLVDLDDRVETVLLVGHNPSVTDTVGFLTGGSIGHMPTTATCRIDFAIDRWGQIEYGKGQILFFDCPGNHSRRASKNKNEKTEG